MVFDGFFFKKLGTLWNVLTELIKGATFKHTKKTFQHIRKTLQHISLYNTFFNQNAKKKLYNTFLNYYFDLCVKKWKNNFIAH